MLANSNSKPQIVIEENLGSISSLTAIGAKASPAERRPCRHDIEGIDQVIRTC